MYHLDVLCLTALEVRASSTLTRTDAAGPAQLHCILAGSGEAGDLLEITGHLSPYPGELLSLHYGLIILIPHLSMSILTHIC